MLRGRTSLAAGALALLVVIALLAWRAGGRGPTPRSGVAAGGGTGNVGAPLAWPAPAAGPISPDLPVHLASPALAAAAPSPGGSFPGVLFPGVLFPGVLFEGRVVSAAGGAGIGGAELTFSRAGEATAVRAAPDGTFQFSPRQPGRWTLATVSAPGFFPFAPEWGHSPVLLDARQGARVRGITVALAPAVEYLGRVVGEDGAPVAGAVVRVLGAAAGEAALLPLRDSYRSDAAGEFAFVAPEGAVLEARHPGFAPARESVDFGVRVSRHLTLTLARSKRLGAAPQPEVAIAGRVEDGAGAPADGAVVVARAEDDAGEPPRQATTDHEGRFELSGLAPGSYRLLASRPGLAPAMERQVKAGTRDVVLRLLEGGRLSGRVRDRASGEPVAPFTVAVRARGRRAELRTLAVVDASGRYEMDGLAPGRALVLVAAPGRAPSQEVEVTIPEPGQPPAVADFELSRGGRVFGLVRDARTKDPVAGAEITVEGQVDLGPSLLPVRARTASGSDGSFELGGVPERLVSVQATAEGHHARLVAGLEVREGDARGPVVVELTPLEPGEEPKLELTGIGASLSPRRDRLVITGLLPGGGADEAGLRPGDEIVRIDGRLVADLSFAAAVNLIRGPEDSSVILGVARRDDTQRSELRVVVYRRLVRN